MKRTLATLSLAWLVLLFGLAGSTAAQTRATVSVRLIDALSSESTQPGDSFTATLAEPLFVGDRMVAQKDARVTGQVREVVSSGRLSRPALLTLSLKRVQSRSGWYPIATGNLTIKASSHATRNLLIITVAAPTCLSTTFTTSPPPAASTAAASTSTTAIPPASRATSRKTSAGRTKRVSPAAVPASTGRWVSSTRKPTSTGNTAATSTA